MSEDRSFKVVENSVSNWTVDASPDTTINIATTVDIIVMAKTTGRRFILRCPNPTDWCELNDVAGELMQQSLLLRPDKVVSVGAL